MPFLCVMKVNPILTCRLGGSGWEVNIKEEEASVTSPMKESEGNTEGGGVGNTNTDERWKCGRRFTALEVEFRKMKKVGFMFII